MKRIFAVLIAALIGIVTVTPTSAALIYVPELDRFVEGGHAGIQPGNSSRKGSTIRRTTVDYETNYAPGTIVVETSERRLYFVLDDGKALKYGIGVGRDGFRWSGTHRITRKAEWAGLDAAAADAQARSRTARPIWKAAPTIRSAPAPFTSARPFTACMAPPSRGPSARPFPRAASD